MHGAVAALAGSAEDFETSSQAKQNELEKLFFCAAANKLKP
jgi:hypothetical protein